MLKCIERFSKHTWLSYHKKSTDVEKSVDILEISKGKFVFEIQGLKFRFKI